MNDLFHELQRTFQTLIRKTGEEWKKSMPKGIAHSHAHILWLLKKNGSMKVSELAEHLSITPGGITGLSDKLIALGYVERQRSIEDRRVVLLSITDEGLEILSSLKQHNNQLTKKFFEGLSEEDALRLMGLLKQVIMNIEEN